MIALREAWNEGLLGKDNWARNIAAGVVVGVVSIPLSMAFAIASGAKPEQGLYTAVVAAIAVSLFGGTRVQIAGPTGAFAVLLYGIVAEHGIAGLIIFGQHVARLQFDLLPAVHVQAVGETAVPGRLDHRRQHAARDVARAAQGRVGALGLAWIAENFLHRPSLRPCGGS